MELIFLEEPSFYNTVFAAVLGGFLAVSELLSRYRTLKLISRSIHAATYILINAAAAGICYYFINKFHLSFGQFSETETGKVLMAGFSAMFILRSSFFSYYDKDSSKTINVGLAAILQTFLDSAERSFDQEQSVNKLKEVKMIMANIDFAKAAIDLTTTCLNLMQNVSSEEQNKLAESIKKLSEEGKLTNNYSRALNLGIILSKITGVRLLKQAVDSHGESIKISIKSKEIFSNLEELKNKIN
jgi:hypothetical protein